jgi:hypothetical protein
MDLGPGPERPPLKPADGMLSLWKDNTHVRRHLLAYADFVPVLLAVERALGDEDVETSVGCYTLTRWIDLKPKDDAHARRLVGALIRALHAQPAIIKVETAEGEAMESRWNLDGTVVTVKGYKPKTCRYEEVVVELPAEEEKVETVVTPAKPARVEKRRRIVCDGAETQDAAEVTHALAAEEEVPF